MRSEQVWVLLGEATSSGLCQTERGRNFLAQGSPKGAKLNRRSLLQHEASSSHASMGGILLLFVVL